MKKLTFMKMAIVGIVLTILCAVVIGVEGFLSSLLLLPIIFGAVTTENSTQYANEIAVPMVKAAANEKKGKARFEYFDFVQGAAAGDANSLVNLVKLPAGRIKVYLTLCKIRNSDFGAGRTLDIGNLAYVDGDGAAVVLDIDALADGLDMNNTTEVSMGSGAGALTTILNLYSRDGVVIQAKVLGGTIPAAATLRGYIVYAVE